LSVIIRTWGLFRRAQNSPHVLMITETRAVLTAAGGRRLKSTLIAIIVRTPGPTACSTA